MNNLNQPKISALIFELGSLQVYHLQTMEEKAANADLYKEIYWRDAGSPQGYGPFVSIWAAMNHYVWIINTCKGDKPVGKPKAGNEVIRVDFINKKRVVAVGDEF